MEILDILKRTYALETTLYTLHLKGMELTNEVKQAKYDLRTARQAQVEYGGFRAFLDKLSGKYAQKSEQFDREVRRAEAKLNAILREQDRNAGALSEAREERNALPSLEELKQSALEEPETAGCWANLECRLCAGKLLPLLEKNEQALMEYRKLLRGEYPIVSVEQQQATCAEPDIWAQQCSDLLQRMQEPLKLLGMSLQISAYYQSPIFYLMYAAAKHNRMDRASQAADQVLATRKQVSKILNQLEDLGS